VTIVRQTGRPTVEVARELGIGAGTWGNWVHKDRLARREESDNTKADPAYVRRLERELAEVRMERDVLRRSVVLWVKEAERHEALVGRAVVKGHRRGLVAAGLSRWGQPDPGEAGKGG
jgi:transposase